MRIISVVIVLVSCAASAFAVPVTFIHTGSGSGTIDGSPFADAEFTIISTGDTDNREAEPDVFSIDHDTSIIEIDGVGTFIVLVGTRTFVNNSVSVVGYSRATLGGSDLFDGPSNAALATWDMLSSIGPIAGSGGTLQWDGDIATDGGTLIFSDASVAATFQAVVPEPSTLALAGLGIAELLACARRLLRPSRSG